MIINDDIIKRDVWEKGRIVDGLDGAMFRLDACGALIMWERFGMVNPFGWEIDHIFPKALGGKDDPENLRPLHYMNNKSKGNDYPSYIACVKFNGQKNDDGEWSMTVNEKIRLKLRGLYENA